MIAKPTQRYDQWPKCSWGYIISKLSAEILHIPAMSSSPDIESQKEGVVGHDAPQQDARHFKPEARFPAEYRTLSIHVDDSASAEKGKAGEKRKLAVKGNLLFPS